MSKPTQALRDFLTVSPSVVYPDEVLELLQPVEDENAKLREQVTRLQSDWESEKDYADQMEAKEKMAVAENAKLRELMDELWALAYGYAPYESELDAARDMMRELGIEVD